MRGETRRAWRSAAITAFSAAVGVALWALADPGSPPGDPAALRPATRGAALVAEDPRPAPPPRRTAATPAQEEPRPPALDPAPSAPTPRTGRIPASPTYRGWLRDGAGRAVAGARVTPWTSAGLARRLDAARAVRSAADGSFELPLEEAGEVELVVEHPEHMSWRGTAPPSPGFLELRPTASLRGQVRDAAGRPAAGSRLRYEARTPGAARRELLVDGSGRFELEGLRAEVVTLWISGPHGALGPLEVETEAEDELLLELDPSRSIGVAAQDGDGRPVAGARVLLVDEVSGRALDSRRTAADGRAEFPAIREGALALRVEHPRLRFAQQPLASGALELQARALPSGSLQLTNPSSSELLVELTPDASLAARPSTLVVAAGAELSCSPLAPGRWSASWRLRGDRNGRPAPSAPAGRLEVVVRADEPTRVELDVASPASLAGTTSWTSAELCAVELRAAEAGALLARRPCEDGRFAFDDLAPGSYELTLCARGGGRWSDPRPVELRAGEHLDLILNPPSAPIAIQARGPDGAPLPNARAWLRESRRPLARQTSLQGGRLERGGVHLPPAEADALGRIPLEFPPSEEAVVVVEAPGHRPLELAISSASIHVDAPLSSR